jgi:hypothetical protein
MGAMRLASPVPGKARHGTPSSPVAPSGLLLLLLLAEIRPVEAGPGERDRPRSRLKLKLRSA